jgi:hypothetical protein
MVGRIWHGYTTPENADAYFSVLKSEVLPGIAAMKIPGYKFITIMWFESLENVKSFTGEDYEVAHVPTNARNVLKRFDARSQHYDLIEELHY